MGPISAPNTSRAQDVAAITGIEPKRIASFKDAGNQSEYEIITAILERANIARIS